MSETSRTPTGVSPGYTLPNAWEQARRRLALLEQCHDPGTERRATALGVGAGWRCLEAGAGAGSVARWLAGRVGARGHVLAVDLDTRLLVDSAAPNLEVRRLDLVDDELPGGFDLVHTRLVLMHLPERVKVLQRLVGALAPGGALLVEEYDFHLFRATETGPYRAAGEACLDVMQAGGAVLEWARGLPALLDAHGLVDVAAEVDAPMFRGGSPTAECLQLTLTQTREPAVALGADPDLIDAGYAELDDPTRWFHAAAMVAVWGRRADPYPA